MTKSAGTIAEVLQGAGYATMAIGKWHLAPLEETTATGPYDEWPLGRGFGRYYGFPDALTDHFYPDVVEDNHRVEPPGRPEDGYHLTEDLIDHAISYVRDQVSVKPEQPFFLYAAFGTAHCPHQAPQEYLDKYRGLYDEGWDVIRERRFARQKEFGIIPEDAVLAPLNPGVEEWDNLTPDQQKLFARFQEAYAAMLDHTDAQMGRLIDFLDSVGRLDNTIIVVLSDNGASQEGGPDGGADIVTYEEDRFCTVDFNMERFDTIGGPHSQTKVAGLRKGLERVTKLGGAAPGHKTMVDALSPALEAAEDMVAKKASITRVITAAAEATRRGLTRPRPCIPRPDELVTHPRAVPGPQIRAP